MSERLVYVCDHCLKEFLNEEAAAAHDSAHEEWPGFTQRPQSLCAKCKHPKHDGKECAHWWPDGPSCYDSCGCKG